MDTNTESGWESELMRCSPTRLVELLDMKTEMEHHWRPEEFGAVLEHQLSAPVQMDLGGLGPELAPKIKALSEAEGLLLRSFADLLYHPHPPVELLRLTKDFAKANRHLSASHLPVQVATVLYYASIVAALVRCGERITRMSDGALKEGIGWVLGQRWVGDRLKELFREGRTRLETGQRET